MPQQPNFLVQYRASLESRVREQIERHQKINPNADPREIVDLAIAQERELLERLRDDEKTPPDQAEVWSAVLEWLPVLAKQLKRR